MYRPFRKKLLPSFSSLFIDLVQCTRHNTYQHRILSFQLNSLSHLTHVQKQGRLKKLNVFFIFGTINKKKKKIAPVVVT